MWRPEDGDDRFGVDVPAPLYWIIKLTPIVAWIIVIVKLLTEK